MNLPVNPNGSSDGSIPKDVGKLVNLWFAVAVIGLFVFACFYILKVAVDLFLPIVLAGFLGFLLTPVTRWLKKIGLSNFWATAHRCPRLFDRRIGRVLIALGRDAADVPITMSFGKRSLEVFRVITDEIDLAAVSGLSLKQSDMRRQLEVAGARSYNNEHLHCSPKPRLTAE